MKQLTRSGNAFDRTIERVLRKLESLYFSFLDDNMERFKELRRCINMILSALGYVQVYLPAQFDRFIMLSLLSPESHELIAMMVSTSEAEDAQNGESPLRNP